MVKQRLISFAVIYSPILGRLAVCKESKKTKNERILSYAVRSLCLYCKAYYLQCQAVNLQFIAVCEICIAD